MPSLSALIGGPNYKLDLPLLWALSSVQKKSQLTARQAKKNVSPNQQRQLEYISNGGTVKAITPVLTEAFEKWFWRNGKGKKIAFYYPRMYKTHISFDIWRKGNILGETEQHLKTGHDLLIKNSLCASQKDSGLGKCIGLIRPCKGFIHTF